MESKRIIQVEDKVPIKLLVPLSIQHMFAMFGASILVPVSYTHLDVYKRQIKRRSAVPGQLAAKPEDRKLAFKGSFIGIPAFI